MRKIDHEILRHPIDLNSNVWLYEDRAGLTIYAAPNAHSSGVPIATLRWARDIITKARKKSR